MESFCAGAAAGGQKLVAMVLWGPCRCLGIGLFNGSHRRCDVCIRSPVPEVKRFIVSRSQLILAANHSTVINVWEPLGFRALVTSVYQGAPLHVLEQKRSNMAELVCMCH